METPKHRSPGPSVLHPIGSPCRVGASGPRARLPGWDGGESLRASPWLHGPTDTGRRTPAPGIRTERSREEVCAQKAFLTPASRAWGRLSARQALHTRPSGEQSLQALPLPTPAPGPTLARKEPLAHRRAGPGLGRQMPPPERPPGSRCRWARSRERKGRAVSPPRPGWGAFGLVEGQQKGMEVTWTCRAGDRAQTAGKS